jgi:hypothetical protein
MILFRCLSKFACLIIPSTCYALTPLQNHIYDLSNSYIRMCANMQILAVKNCKSEKFLTIDDCFRDLKPLFPKREMPIYDLVEKNYNQNWKSDSSLWIKDSEQGFKDHLEKFNGSNEKACIATATQYRTYRYLKWEEIKMLLNLDMQ